MQDSAIQKVAQKYSLNDVSIILFTDEKTFTVTPPKNPAEWPTLRISINQGERRRDKTSSHTINVQSLMTSVGETQVVEITLILVVDHVVKVTEEY